MSSSRLPRTQERAHCPVQHACLVQKMQRDSKWQLGQSQGDKDAGRITSRMIERAGRKPALQKLSQGAGSASNAHFAEAYQHAAPRLRTSKAELRAEPREEHHLIQLALHGLIIGAGKNLVVDHFARSIQR